MYYKTKPYRVFTLFNNAFMLFLAVICIAPMVHVVALSFSSAAAANVGAVYFWPVDFTLESYRLSLGNPNFLQSMLTSLHRTVLGTAITMALISCAAYALSKPDRVFRGRTWYAWLFVFTMLFNAGLIPSYLVVKQLGLIDSMWALVLPPAVSVFSMIILIHFFRGVSKEMEEAAFVDGANHFQTLWYIYLPVSLPSLATLTLFSLVFHWNAYFDGLIFMNDYRDYPLATLLYTTVIRLDFTSVIEDQSVLQAMSERTIKASQILIGTLPIVLIYPFLQRYFVTGITLGAVKE